MNNLITISNTFDTNNLLETTFEELCSQILNPTIKIAEQPSDDLKKTLPLIYPCNFSSTKISKEDVTEYNYIFVDYDDSNFKTISEFFKICRFNFLAYTSLNHKFKNPNSDRFRIIFPLEQPISKDDFEILACDGTFSEFFKGSDPSTFSSNRGFVVPVRTPYYQQFIYTSGNNISINTFAKINARKFNSNQNANAVAYFSKPVEIKNSDKKPQSYINKVIDGIIDEARRSGADFSRDGGYNVGKFGEPTTGTDAWFFKVISRLHFHGADYQEVLTLHSRFAPNMSYNKRKEWSHKCDSIYNNKVSKVKELKLISTNKPKKESSFNKFSKQETKMAPQIKQEREPESILLKPHNRERAVDRFKKIYEAIQKMDGWQ